MVAHFTMRTYRVNQAFRCVEGIWLYRNWGQIRFFSDRPYFTPYVRNKFSVTILYKYQDFRFVILGLCISKAQEEGQDWM